jgi:phosphatidylserine/phosphatidylglycerophosphate/cardiolipin synthase-like enzyme
MGIKEFWKIAIGDDNLTDDISKIFTSEWRSYEIIVDRQKVASLAEHFSTVWQLRAFEKRKAAKSISKENNFM